MLIFSILISYLTGMTRSCGCHGKDTTLLENWCTYIAAIRAHSLMSTLGDVYNWMGPDKHSSWYRLLFMNVMGLAGCQIKSVCTCKSLSRITFPSIYYGYRIFQRAQYNRWSMSVQGKCNQVLELLGHVKVH
jgi:hypothetical protein